MGPTQKPRVKICCISSIDEAKLAIDLGASALGLVSSMPTGPGIISENSIAKIIKIVPPSVSTFLLTSKQDAGSITRQQRYCGANTVQLCDSIPENEYHNLRNSMPGIAIVQVIHVNGDKSQKEAEFVAPHVNGILLDSGNPNLTVKKLGGTGRTHNWLISKNIRETVDVPVFLAGGLNATNISKAIRQVNPFGVDVCSGVRTNGKLDKKKLTVFLNNIQESVIKVN